MRAVIQRTTGAEVFNDKGLSVQTAEGMVVFLGVEADDDTEDVDYIVNKILKLRIFEDKNGRMNQSIIKINGDILFISQFTLLGDCRKGTRPSFVKAARSEHACDLYEKAAEQLSQSGINIKKGFFGEFMNVTVRNSGPVTILIDSKKKF